MPQVLPVSEGQHSPARFRVVLIWLYMESSDIDHASDILIGEVSLELLREGKKISLSALLDKLKQRAAETDCESHHATLTLASKKLEAVLTR